MEPAALVTIDYAAAEKWWPSWSFSVETSFASQRLVNQKWEPQRLCNTGSQSFFASVFCSVSVKSSDHSKHILSQRHNGDLSATTLEGEQAGFDFELPIGGWARFQLRVWECTCRGSNRVALDEDGYRMLPGGKFRHLNGKGH